MHKIIPQNMIKIFLISMKLFILNYILLSKKLKTSDKVQELENESYKKFEAADS
jgi:hypothetical protein